MLTLFAYNFPHRKTQDFLFFCHHYKIKVNAVIAADFVELNFPEKKYRSHIRPIGLIHPKEICDSLSIPFYRFSHNSDESLAVLKKIKPVLGLISGARILSQDIIDCFAKGIVNFHPGLIPEVRGLDTLHWSIYDNIPLGVTSHFIDSRIDAGHIIMKHPLPVFYDDTLSDISLRLYEGQLEIFNQSLQMAMKYPKEEFELLDYNCKPSYKCFPANYEDELHEKIEAYLSKYSSKQHQDARLWYSGRRMVKSYVPE